MSGGKVATDEQVRRMTFPAFGVLEQPDGAYSRAISLLGGPDTGGNAPLVGQEKPMT